MSGLVHEPRTAVMMLVEASWEDSHGALQTAPARMEDRSTGGACIRLKTPVQVGSKLKIQSRREQFYGVIKYCRSDGKEYVVGVQRDATPLLSQPVSVTVPVYEPAETAPPKIEAKQAPANRPETNLSVVAPPPQESQTALQTHEPSNVREDSPKARKSMRNKLLELTRWHSKANDLPEIGESNGNGMQPFTPSAPPTAVDPAPAGVAKFEVELLPIEDIYRAAGILNLRSGHSIHRVVEMLHSEHIRDLSNEMRRAAILMALDAAGIPVDQVLQDAKVRQEALDTYEASQQKQIEAEWARKAEENVQIQDEMERVKAHYAARIVRNTESVAREKITFSSWQTKKQQESRSIAEAVALFSKPEVQAAANSSSANKS